MAMIGEKIYNEGDLFNFFRKVEIHKELIYSSFYLSVYLPIYIYLYIVYMGIYKIIYILMYLLGFPWSVFPVSFSGLFDFFNSEKVVHIDTQVKRSSVADTEKQKPAHTRMSWVHSGPWSQWLQLFQPLVSSLLSEIRRFVKLDNREVWAARSEVCLFCL